MSKSPDKRRTKSTSRHFIQYAIMKSTLLLLNSLEFGNDEPHKPKLSFGHTISSVDPSTTHIPENNLYTHLLLIVK